MTDESILPFGKHAGTKLKDVPSGYLLYLYNKGIAFGELRIYIDSRLDVLNAQSSLNHKGRFFNKKYYLKK